MKFLYQRASAFPPGERATMCRPRQAQVTPGAILRVS